MLAFIGTPDYEARKRQRIRGGDELNIARNPVVSLSDPTVRERYPRKHEDIAGRYYAGQVPFAVILTPVPHFTFRRRRSGARHSDGSLRIAGGFWPRRATATST